jgi:hypothetical protein
VRDMAATTLHRAALALSPDAPNAALARITGRPKATARAWIAGRRRPPVAVLLKVQEELRRRARDMWEIGNNGGALDCEIWRRRREPKPKLCGFFEVKQRDGPGSVPRDARNRLGRPTKAALRSRRVSSPIV